MKFLDVNLDLRMLDDGRHWQLLSPFSYSIGSPTGRSVVHVEAGFITDFASVPRIFWNLLPPTGRYARAALLHDKLYQSALIVDSVTAATSPIDRRYADDVLAESCRVLAANEMLRFGAQRTEFWDWLDREILFRGVRLGGFVAWNAYRRTDALREGQP